MSFPALSAPLGMMESARQLNGRQFAAASAGGAEEIDIDPDPLLMGVDLVCTYSVTGITGGTLRVENPFSLIRVITVTVSGADAVIRMSGYEAFLLAQIFRGRSNPIPFDRLASAAGTVSSGKFTIPLDCALQGINPAHFGFIPAQYCTSLKIRLDYATSFTDAFAYGGTGGTISMTPTLVKRVCLERSPNPGGYGSVVRQSNTYSIAATADPTPLRNLEAGTRYAGFLLVSRDTSNAALSDSAGITGTVTLYLDSTTKRDSQSFTDLREQTRRLFPENYPGTSTRWDLTGVLYLNSGRLAGKGQNDDGDIIPSLASAVDATEAREVRLDVGATVGTATQVSVTGVRIRALEQTAAAFKLPVA